MQGYCDVYKWTILKRTSPEVKCLHPTSSRREICTSSVRYVIYHNFLHGAAFYAPNGNNVNVMLEFTMKEGIILSLLEETKIYRMLSRCNLLEDERPAQMHIYSFCLI